MFARLVLRWLCLGVSLGVLAGADRPAKSLKIYIETDLEGASGVFKFSQTREKDTPLNIEACEFLMGDIAAVVRGLRAGGATEIIVSDGHGTQAFLPRLMEPGAKYITGTPRPSVACGLDETCAGMVMVGCHAMMGTADGVLCHTQSSRSENRYWYNGVETGEIGQSAIVASYYGVPPLMVTGDEATCRETKKFFGEPCVTVAVKRGLAREAAELYPFAETRQALFEGAKRAMAELPNCKPYQVKLPIQAKKQWYTLDANQVKGKLMTKEGEILDLRDLYKF
jgi:D-amino peptidase